MEIKVVDTANFQLRRSHWLPILLLILLIAVFLRVKLYTGFIPLDDAEYAKIAFQISQGTFSRQDYAGPPVFPLRIGIVLPTAFLFRIFGPSEWSMAIYPLALSLSILVLVFFFTSRLFNYFAGLGAAAIWAFLPKEMEISTMLRPDLPATFYAFLGVFVIYSARRAGMRNRLISFAFGAVGGLSFGAAWLCKSSVLYFIPFCLILILYDLKRDFNKNAAIWSGVALGSILVFGGESIFYFLQTGDWLFRVHEIDRNYILYPEWFFVEGSRFGVAEGASYLKGLIKRLFLDGPSMIFLNITFLYLPFFGLLACLHAWLWKDQRFYFMTFLFASLIIMFNFATTSLTSYKPLPLFIRYFYPLCFPAAVLTSGLLSKLIIQPRINSQNGRTKERLFWGCVLAAIIIIIVGYSTFRGIRGRSQTWSAAEKAVAHLLGPSDRLYTDPLSKNGIEFFGNYSSKVNIINYSELPVDKKIPYGSYLLVNKSYNEWLKINKGTWLNKDGFQLPHVVKNPPKTWKKLWYNNNAVLYRVDG